MNIGVYLGKGLPLAQAGGGFTFQQGLLRILLNTETEHNFYIFCYQQQEWVSTRPKVKFVIMSKYSSSLKSSMFAKAFLRFARCFERLYVNKKYRSYLNRSCLQNNIELMWFMTPAYEYVEVPYIYTIWDLQHRYQSYFPEVSVTGSTFEQRENFCKKIIQQAAYVVAGNLEGKREVELFYSIPEFRVKTIAMPTPPFALEKHLARPKTVNIKNPFLFYPAQFWPHKNHITLLFAAKILKEKFGINFDIVFTASDKGNLAYIKEKTKEFNLTEQVHFLGFVDIKKIIQLYKNAFALIFASFFGPDNIPPLEAFGLGCPVISANFAGAKEQMRDAALFFEPGDECELAEQIKKLYDNPDLRSEIVARGYGIAKECSCENYIKKIIEIVDEFKTIRRCWSSKERYIHT
jgi:glycosyltransferase involved in cell wall biosynthesis